MADVECYRCHKKGHYANKCPEAKAKDSKGVFKVRKMEESVVDKAVEEPKSIRQIRIRFSDLTMEDNDPFIRYWIKVYGNQGLGNGADAEGKDVRVFVDTGANVNTMSRRQFMAFFDWNMDFEYIEGPFGGLEVKLVGGQTLHVAGDRVRIMTEVATTMGKVRGVEEFLVLDNDAEDMVMGVYWYQRVTNGGGNDPNIRILDMRNFGVFMQNPLENGSDDAPEDALMDNANVDVYPEAISEAWEQCHFNLAFPKLDHLKAIVREHGRTLFQPFDQEGSRVEPLKLKVKPSASFRMQPCRFVREGTLRQLKELLDQFVSEGVLIPDNSCDFASPLVIVQKKEGGIRMAVDYREVNLQLDGTANQLPYQPMLFQKLGGQKYFAKVDNL
jgi:hypothetical protein